MSCWQGAVPPPESSYPYAVPQPESSEQVAILPQNCLLAASSAQCQVGHVPDFVFLFFCVFCLLFDENEVYLKKIALIVIFSLHSKIVCVSCIRFLHYFLCLKPLALFCRYYSLELEIYISFSLVGFGLFWTYNA